MKKINREKKGVKIAVIDSGFTPHIDINKGLILKGIGLYYANNKIKVSDNYEDLSGHGTAIVGIINDNIPDAEIYVIKVLDYKNQSNCELLLKGIEVAIDYGVDIINLSLGTTIKEYKKEFLKICKYAMGKGVHLVAAENMKMIYSLPARIEGVINVFAGHIYSNKKIYNSDKGFIAQGIKRMLYSLNDRYKMLGGSSFATPIVTSLVAKIIQEKGRLPNKYMYSELRKRSYKVCNGNIMKVLIERYENISENIDKYIFKETLLGLERVVPIYDYNQKLISQGLTSDKYYTVLRQINNSLPIKYTEFSYLDFFNVYSLASRVQKSTKSIQNEKERS